MLQHSNIDEPSPCGFTLEQVHLASSAKSFDFRILHMLLFLLIKKPYNDTLLEFLRVDECLIDISDDLLDYEEDVLSNSFNIFRAYLHIHGSDAGELQLVRHLA
eukprot:evm.model.scf_159.4 EVM.evm.TU.scf_159.4   scf_159:33780-34786(-)